MIVGGLPMLNWNFCCVWNTDARPFPTFPTLNSAWGDAGNWAQGLWIGTTRAVLPPPAPSPPPTPLPSRRSRPSRHSAFRSHIKPKFSTLLAQHVSGRETRTQQIANPLL